MMNYGINHEMARDTEAKKIVGDRLDFNNMTLVLHLTSLEWSNIKEKVPGRFPPPSMFPLQKYLEGVRVKLFESNRALNIFNIYARFGWLQNTVCSTSEQRRFFGLSTTRENY